MSTWRDEPVPYALTDTGWAATRAPVTLTISEAVVHAGRVKSRILELARTGRIDAVQVDGRWLIDGASLDAYLARPRHGARKRGGGTVQHRWLSADPLLRQVALRGGDAACGVEQGSATQKALERAREAGTVTVWTADHLAVHLLGLTLWDLWDAPGEG